jgi:hypothetical protein
MYLADSLRLAWPHGISNAPDKLQLLPHILVTQRVTLRVRCKTTLRADAALLDRILSRLSSALCNPVGGLVNTGNHLILVFKSGEFGGDHTKNDILVLREVGKRLEATSASRVVLKVVGVDVKVLQELAISLRSASHHSLPGKASLQWHRKRPRRSDGFQRSCLGRDGYRDACRQVAQSTCCRS